MTAITIPKGFRVTPKQFDELAYSNTDVRMELTAQGELITIPPTGGTAGGKNFDMNLDLGIWNRANQLGKAFDSSTIFILPNGSRRSPDVSWIQWERWNRLTPEQKDGFPNRSNCRTLREFQSKTTKCHFLLQLPKPDNPTLPELTSTFSQSS